ncbi:uncharacterized protein BDR25DRAFT_358215 [Lindgomyces ingoldianus]|uniref:Uncharacterized protein n=1 Tax=Lindgomyces ingoldianus TaxID=673940 RepID=A0ACB6QP72_9PLEO|nr:uncharacterized protein BDR25DRAFT_358215 [Lindgomyces ingoldianus]KAF2467961.1 hypothetical protein BDR25DRAFT_358215 [Lindgomyces ingoldianus]
MQCFRLFRLQLLDKARLFQAAYVRLGRSKMEFSASSYEVCDSNSRYVHGGLIQSSLLRPHLDGCGVFWQPHAKISIQPARPLWFSPRTWKAVREIVEQPPDGLLPIESCRRDMMACLLSCRALPKTTCRVVNRTRISDFCQRLSRDLVSEDHCLDSMIVLLSASGSSRPDQHSSFQTLLNPGCRSPVVESTRRHISLWDLQPGYQPHWIAMAEAGASPHDKKVLKKEKVQSFSFSALKDFPFSGKHRNKDGQKADTTNQQSQDGPLTAPASPKGPPTALARSPTAQSILPPVNDRYELSRMEMLEMENKYTARTIDTNESNGPQGETSLPPPLKINSEVDETTEPIGLPGTIIPPRKALQSTPKLGELAPLSRQTTDPPTIPNGNGCPVYREELGDLQNVQDLQERMKLVLIENTRLKEELKDEKLISGKHWRWFKEEQQANIDLKSRLAAMKEQLREDESAVNRAVARESEIEHIVTEKNMCIQGLNAELKDLRTSRDLEVNNAANMTQQIIRLQEDLQQSQKNVQNVTNELMQFKSQLNSKVDDRWFVEQWTDLHSKIQNISTKFFAGKISRHSGAMASRGKGKFDVCAPRCLMQLTPDYTQYISSENYRPLLIQAFIWWILNNKVFDHASKFSEGLYWAGGMRDSLANLKGELRPLRRRDRSRDDVSEAKRQEAEAQNFHKWRSTTAIMLISMKATKHRIVHSHVNDLITEVTNTVAPFIARKESERAKAEEVFGDELHEIIVAAISLDAEIQQQRGWIYCEQWADYTQQEAPVHGFRWKDMEMTQVYGPAQAKGGANKFADPCVELIVQPALFREGNSNGKEYSAAKRRSVGLKLGVVGRLVLSIVSCSSVIYNIIFKCICSIAFALSPATKYIRILPSLPPSTDLTRNSNTSLVNYLERL